MFICIRSHVYFEQLDPSVHKLEQEPQITVILRFPTVFHIQIIIHTSTETQSKQAVKPTHLTDNTQNLNMFQ